MRRDVLERRLARGVEFDELVVGARQHAMRGGEHQVARDRDAAAEAARADQHHHVPRHHLVRVGGAADHRGRGDAGEGGMRAEDQRAGEGGERARQAAIRPSAPVWSLANNCSLMLGCSPGEGLRGCAAFATSCSSSTLYFISFLSRAKKRAQAS